MSKRKDFRMVKFSQEIPVELSGNKYKSIVIRGESGTGKSTLALELVNVHSFDAYYITTRITPNAIRQNFNWILEEKITFIDVTHGLTSINQEAEKRRDDI